MVVSLFVASRLMLFTENSQLVPSEAWDCGQCIHCYCRLSPPSFSFKPLAV
ncbi:unnamed protein product [Linum tenue]|uniref:Uncharacterized protein n=1 Tax=Linum tenue TaxID=586396 RepID=A0AAV0H7Y5_9ROSI|nr:unnamed protein product [Linum tenue]